MKYLIIISIIFSNFLVCFQHESTDVGSTIMTYNIRYDNPNDKNDWWELRKGELAQLIQYYHPDIFGIQEGLSHQVDYLDDQLINHRYIGVGRDDGKQKGEYTALFYDTTKYSLNHELTFWLSDTPKVISVGWDASMERICTYGKFLHNNSKQILHVFNAHFDHRGPESRLQASTLMLSMVDSLAGNSEAVIVMGDFNAMPTEAPIMNFKKQLDNTSAVSIKPLYGPVGTFNGFKTDIIVERRLDYIFSKNLTIHSYRHIDDRRENKLWVSDHLPVICSISFN